MNRASSPPCRALSLMAIATLAISAAGCGTPSAANIKLRKQLEQKNEQIASLERRHTGDLADLSAMHDHTPTTASLPADRLERLYTVHGLSLGRLTGGAELGARSGDGGLKVYVVPTDDDDQPIKAAGSFRVEAFDLADNGKLVGRWDFDTAAAKRNWYGAALLYNYVLPAPWQHGPPAHPQLTLKVTYNDDLTGREFSVQREVTVKLPPTTAPTDARL